MPSSRGNWGTQIEFILASIGCAVGLGNVWRFPYLTYTSGGGAFLIPYFISLFLIGIPFFCIDISFGQFTSLGPIKGIGEISPIFRGVGISTILWLVVVMSYYSIVIATCFHYLFASLTSYVPWTDCLNEWNTCSCRQNINDTDYLNNTYISCGSGTVVKTISPAEEYYTKFVLDESPSIADSGHLQWRLALSSLFMWVLLCLLLSKGVKTIGKAAYFFTLLPYVVLTILLIRGLTLDGYSDGIYYYVNPQVELLAEPKVWADAAVQIFYSTSTCTGALIAMASFNKFSHNTFRDSFLIPIINCLTSFYGGFATFAILGFMANEQGVEVKDVTSQGPGLAFVVYPSALARMPVAPLWSILFFLMMVSLGISSLLTIAETIIMSITDIFPQCQPGAETKWKGYALRTGVCLVAFFLGLPQVSQAGTYIINLLDTFMGGFPILIIGLFEIIVFIYLYGFHKFGDDVKFMLGDTRLARNMYKFYFQWCWYIITPLAVVIIIISKCVDYTSIIAEPTYPPWSEALGWLAALFPLVSIPGYAIYYVIRYHKTQKFADMFKPTPEWGPLDEDDRTRWLSQRKPNSNKVHDSDELKDVSASNNWREQVNTSTQDLKSTNNGDLNASKPAGNLDNGTVSAVGGLDNPAYNYNE